jgi:NAD+ synthase
MSEITNKIIVEIKEYFRKTNGKTAVIGISGGKDSTVAAALCVRALGKENVFGVLMPNGLTSNESSKDLEDGKEVCRILGIKYYIFDIHQAYYDILTKVENLLYCNNCKIEESIASNQTKINLAPRIRMTTLYAIAQSLNGGRVINTTNACERYVGYGTLWGDTVGDFSIFKNIKVSQVYKIGDELGLPHELVHKTPSDGLTGKSDEDVLGVTYKEIETFMKTDGVIEEDWNSCKGIFHESYQRISELHHNSRFKRNMINLPGID